MPHVVHRQVLGAPVHWLIACIAAAWLGSMETQSRIRANLEVGAKPIRLLQALWFSLNLANLPFCFSKIHLGSQEVAYKLIFELQHFVVFQTLGIAVTRLENHSTWKIGCGESEGFGPVTVRRL